MKWYTKATSPLSENTMQNTLMENVKFHFQNSLMCQNLLDATYILKVVSLYLTGMNEKNVN